MNSALKIRREVEEVLARRIPSALTMRPAMARPLLPSGMEAVDTLLGGGFPVGSITELVGPQSSGRTSLTMSFVAGCLRAGKVAAWIDVSDALCPEAAEAAGVDLERLLWVRCGVRPVVADEIQAAAGICAEPGGAAAGSVTGSYGGGSPHPRSEGVGLPEALSDFFGSRAGTAGLPEKRRDKSIGTPGVANRPVTPKLEWRSEHREEQANSDRQPKRRGENVRLPAGAGYSGPRLEAKAGGARRPLGEALDQALRAADLVMQAGGFSVVVLDLASVAAEVVWKIPLATWFRFRAAAERTQACVVLLTQHACAKSAAEVVLRMGEGTIEAEGRVMTGVAYRTELERQRFAPVESNVVSIGSPRKPPQSERGAAWGTRASWAAGGAG